MKKQMKLIMSTFLSACDSPPTTPAMGATSARGNEKCKISVGGRYGVKVKTEINKELR